MLLSCKTKAHHHTHDMVILPTNKIPVVTQEANWTNKTNGWVTNRSQLQVDHQFVGCMCSPIGMNTLAQRALIVLCVFLDNKRGSMDIPEKTVKNRI